MYRTASMLCYLIIHPYTPSLLSSCFSSVLYSQLDQILNRIPLFLSHSANHPHVTQRDGLVSNQPSGTDSTLAMLSAPEPVPDHLRISQYILGSTALNRQAVRRTRRNSRVCTRPPSGRIRTIKPSLSGTISRYPSRDPFVQGSEPVASEQEGLPSTKGGLKRPSGLISLLGSVCLSLSSFPSVLSLQCHQYDLINVLIRQSCSEQTDLRSVTETPIGPPANALLLSDQD
ncbi:hypothetical protein YC2023_098647 [Brassica napus]